MLEEPEGRVAQVGPRTPEKHAGMASVHVREGFAVRPLGVGAIVAEKDDHRVVELPAFFQAIDQDADLRIEMGDHRRVAGHDFVVGVLLRWRQGIPRLHEGIARRKRPRLVDEAHLHLALIARLAEHIPALLIDAVAELGDLLRRRLQREVGRVFREVKIERLFGGERLVDELQAVGRPQVGGIPRQRDHALPVADVLAVEIEPGIARVGPVKAAGFGIE
jgi:hypothetical protein